MNILILGSGGREHTLAWSIIKSPSCTNLYVAPGNAGTDSLATNLSLNVNDFEGIESAIRKYEINLLVVGPEDPLVNGIRDFLEAIDDLKDLMIVGPGKTGAQLEGSKDFSKKFMFRNGIPTAAYSTFTPENIEQGYQFLETLSPPYVLKADGLAAGKGVVILDNLEEAKSTLSEMLVDQKFGDASSRVVIEEFLTGIELSVFVLTDGQNYLLLPEAKDYKRIGEKDTGPNTGGMGAVSPVPFADEDFMDKIKERIILPTIQGLKSEDIDYRGFIFFGLIKVGNEPMVIEYNVRMGDPETQAVLPRLQSDLVELLTATAKGQIGDLKVVQDPDFATTVVMVSGGYPGSYSKGIPIHGLKDVQHAEIFHAGTKKDNNEILTNGGRVLAFTGRGETIKKALEDSYAGINQVNWKDAYYRKDIGQDLLSV